MLKVTGKSFASWPWHPFLLSAYAVLALASWNIQYVSLAVVIRPLSLSLLASLLLLVLLRCLLKDWLRAGLLATCWLLLFFSYGHLYELLRSVQVFHIALGRNRYLAPLWLTLAALSLYAAIRKSLPLKSISSTLNLFLFVALLFPLARLTRAAMRPSTLPEASLPRSFSLEKPLVQPSRLPDIYYIVLDAYGRSDVLARAYSVDNSEFIGELEKRDFYVATCSQSNYAQTALSFASTLNLNYLDALGVSAQNGDWMLRQLIQNNTIGQVLSSYGYETVAFATGFPNVEWTNADRFLSPLGSRRVTEFEALLLRSSASLTLLDLGLLKTDAETAEAFRERTRFVLDALEKFPREAGPKFVFAHLIIPHPPFVFDSHGEPTGKGPQPLESQYSAGEYRVGYAAQVEFINGRILTVVDKIMADSSEPPIIVIAGDHGPGFSSHQDRMSILNAYYLPEGNVSLYRTISPVNTFRLILKEYFYYDFDLLPDLGYFSLYTNPYEYELIPVRCP